jgi:hypothetical protein
MRQPFGICPWLAQSALLDRSHRRPTQKLLAHGLVDKQQLRPERVPGDSQHGTAYANNDIALIHE